MAMKKADELKASEPFLNFGNGRKLKMIGHGIGRKLNEPPMLSSYEHSRFPKNSAPALDMHMMNEEFWEIKLYDMMLIGEKENKILTRTPRELFGV
jgi:Xaa-Pro aminopeptidase